MDTLTGGCHCQAIRFEVDIATSFKLTECNCSICRMAGYVHLIVPKSRFRLISGSDALATYTFNTNVARHHFCRICGIKSFYIPRSHPDGVSVNARCLDDDILQNADIALFDGRKWEDSIDHLRQEIDD